MTYKQLVITVLALGPIAVTLPAQQPAITRDPEPRLVRPLNWQRPNIARALSASRSELGLQGGKVAAEARTIDGQACLVGSLVAFDVDDSFAFDIDEPVDVTVTYAAGVTTPFTTAWDRNGGEGYGVSSDITPETGPGMRRVTFRLDRARFSNQGVQSTDFAVGARNGTIALCDVTIARSNTTAAPAALGRLHLEVKDTPSSKAMPARVGLYAANGRMPLPSEQAVAVHRYADLARMQWVNRRAVWPSDNRQFFYISGAYDAPVPAGVYDLVITRGPEFRAYRGKIEVTANATTTSTIVLDRYADMPAAGWYSGESHIHLPRQKTDDLDVWAQLAAEDIHVSNLLEMGNITTTYYRQPTWGKPGIFGRDGYFLVPGQEDPRTVMRGHTIHWNVGEHQHHEDTFFRYHTVFEKTRATGALTGYAHLGELFNGQRGLATDVPFGLVEFIEVLQGGRLNSEIWYRFLNLGYRISPVGGADYPYFGPTLPGVERTYVKVDGTLSPETWFSSFRRGHVFVSNGPLLDFTVNGKMMGDELRGAEGHEAQRERVRQAQSRHRRPRPSRARRPRRREHAGAGQGPGQGGAEVGDRRRSQHVDRRARAGPPSGGAIQHDRPHRADLRGRRRRTNLEA